MNCFFENGNKNTIQNLSSPDWREKPLLFLQSFGRKAGKWITQNAQAFRSKNLNF